MDWEAFVTAVFTSSGAAGIAFGSAAWVYARTRKAETRDAAERERRERIGRVQTAVHSDLAHALARWRGLWVGTGVIKVSEALTPVVAAEWVEHEAVARWALEQLEKLGDAVDRLERRWLLPGYSKRAAALIEPATSMATALALWERGVIADDWFAERLSEDNQEALRRASAGETRKRRWIRRRSA